MTSWWMRALESRQLIPKISATERTALEAGTVWADAELFSGRPDFRRLLAEPYPQLTRREQAFLDGPVAEVCRMVDPWRVQRERQLPAEAWAFLREQRFFGLQLPEEYGGLGFSTLCLSAVFGQLVTRSMYLSTVVLIPNSVGPGELLLAYGTEAQQRHYLPRLARGEELPCFALTEPEAGSDAASLRSEGVVFRGPDGQPRLRLTWNKRYITLAPLATLIGLAVRLRDPEELLGQGPEPGISCVLVPAATPGVEIGQHHDPMGIAFPNGPIRGRDVEVSADQIIGGPAGAGRGWRMLMEALSGGRAVSLPAQAAAGARWTARVTGAYGAVRRQFGVPIGRFEGVEEPLARIAGLTYLMEAARVYTCGALDAGQRPAVVSALMKYNLTELGRQLISDGMDVMGGAAICRGPSNLLADGYIGAPIGITVEGANILTRTLITFGQGILRCHPYALREVRALEQGDGRGLARALGGHAVFVLGNGLRAAWLGLTRGGFRRSPVPGVPARHVRRLAWAAARFALWADLALLTLGANMKRRGKLTGRFADVLSWLFLATATLRRFAAEGRQPEDLPLLTWALEHSLQRIQLAFEGICRNFRAPLLGPLMRGPVLWWLRLNPLSHGPSDAQGSAAAAVLGQPGTARDRLATGIDLSHPALRRLERAFELTARAEPLRRKLAEARRQGKWQGSDGTSLASAVVAGVLTSSEAELLAQAEGACREAIAVDELSFAEYAGIRAPLPPEPALAGA